MIRQASIYPLTLAGDQVGILAMPAYPLDVGGAIRGTNIYNTALTSGSILFAGTGGLISQDNANLFWDDTNNRLGVGLATPLYRLHVYALSNDAGSHVVNYYEGVTANATTTVYGSLGSAIYSASATANQTSGLYGIAGRAYNQSTYTTALLQGVRGEVYNLTTGVVTSGAHFRTGIYNPSGTITNRYGLYIEDTLGTTTNQYGVYSENLDGAGTLNYFLYSLGGTNYLAGNLGIGVTAPAALIHGIKTTEQLRLGYDASKYVSFTTNSTGTTLINSVANVAIGDSVGSYPASAALTIAKTITGGYYSFGLVLQGSYTSPSSDAYAMWMQPTLTPAAGASAICFYSNAIVATGAATAVGAAYGGYIAAMSKTGTGTITNAMGLIIYSPTIGTTNFGLYVSGTATNYMGGPLTCGALTANGAGSFTSDSSTTLSIKGFSSAFPWTYPYINIQRARGTTAVPASVVAGDYVGGVNFYGYNNSANRGIASFSATVESVSGDFLLGRLNFSISAGVDSGANQTTFYCIPTGVYFNSGKANQDFNVAGQVNANLIFVDASGDKVSFGTTNVGESGYLLRVAGGAQGNADATYDLGSSALRWNNIYLAASLVMGDGTNNITLNPDYGIVLNGTSTVWKDVFFPMGVPKAVGTGNPTLTNWTGNLNNYTFAVNDVHNFDPQEFPHDGKQGATTCSLHVHWISRTNVAATRGVKWEIEYTQSNIGAAFPATTTISAEETVPANTAVGTHFLTVIGTFTAGNIGNVMCVRMKRIAASGTAPADDPVVLAVHYHYEADGVGSRTITAK